MHRFWKKVNKGTDNECWVWNARKNHDGYGEFWYNNHTVKAHRMSWLLHNGLIPDDKCILHRCDNPPCVNPKHLWIGSLKDNTRDMISKSRQNFVGDFRHLPRNDYHGEDRSNAKLNDEKVMLMRRLHKKSGLSTRKLAKMFSIGKSVAWSVIAQSRWKHI